MSSHADGNEFCTVHPFSLDLEQKKTSNHVGPHNIGRVNCGICMIKVHGSYVNSFGNNCILVAWKDSTKTYLFNFYTY